MTRAKAASRDSNDSSWPNSSQINESGMDMGFDESLQDFQAEIDFEALDWISILSGLNSSFTWISSNSYLQQKSVARITC